MDSISQFALGAAIGEATLGSRIGRKAILIGGLLGTLPDLDVLVHYADAVESFTYHRSWSHSLFVLSLVSPILAWIIYRAFPSRWALPLADVSNRHLPPSYKRWLCCVFLVLITHPVLDGFTIYGTQLLWPLQLPPVAWGSIFIIDPAYTVPLIIGLVFAYRVRERARQAAIIGIVVSSVYLGLTLLSQSHARQVAIRSLTQLDISTDNVLVAPSPLSLLWRIVAMDGDQYHEGYYSLFDKSSSMQFAAYPSNRALIDANYAHWPVSRLDWFTQGMISASEQDGGLIVNDLRMGVEASYVFRFRVGALQESRLTLEQSILVPMQFDTERIGAIVERVRDENVSVQPSGNCYLC